MGKITIFKIGQKVKCINTFENNPLLKEYGADYPVLDQVYTIKEICFSPINGTCGLMFVELSAGQNQIGYNIDAFEPYNEWVEQLLVEIILDVERDFQI